MVIDFEGRETRRGPGYVARAFVADERGATSIEYALIAGGIFLAIISVIGEIGPAVEGMYTDVRDAF